MLPASKSRSHSRECSSIVWLWVLALSGVTVFQLQGLRQQSTILLQSQRADKQQTLSFMNATLLELRQQLAAARSQVAAEGCGGVQKSIQQGLQGLEASVQQGMQGLQESVNSLPATLKAELPLLQRANGSASGSNLPDAPSSLCGRLGSIFAKPPPVVELPLSASAAAQDASFSRFNLVPDISATAQQASRNFSLYVYADHDIVSKSLANSGSWEGGLISQVLDQLYEFARAYRLSNEEVYFIDIGANVGTFTMAVAAHGFSVISFEAMFSNQQVIRLSLCANPGLAERVTLIGKGLGKEPTTCALYSGNDNLGDGHVRCGSDAETPDQLPGGSVKRATVEIVRLDDQLRYEMAKLAGRVGAVKIDIEGNEPLAVAGGLEFFRRVAPAYILAECDDALIKTSTGDIPGPWLSQMAELGYRVYYSGGREIPPEQLATYQGCRGNELVFREG